MTLLEPRFLWDIAEALKAFVERKGEDGGGGW